jgi:CHASE1-domain containing sensor protein
LKYRQGDKRQKFFFSTMFCPIAVPTSRPLVSLTPASTAWNNYLEQQRTSLFQNIRVKTTVVHERKSKILARFSRSSFHKKFFFEKQAVLTRAGQCNHCFFT